MESKIVRIDAVTIEGKRPRSAGANARLGVHGETIRLPLVCLTSEEGIRGFGRGRVDSQRLADLVGRPLHQFLDDNRVVQNALDVEVPLLDLAARIAGLPFYQFLSGRAAVSPLSARSYDTSLYFDDLHLDDDDAAADLIAQEARFGYDHGHRAFKIKVGRGARHLPLVAGTRRDLAIIHAVREAVGPESEVLIDANNGWNLNLTKQVLLETAAVDLYWVEEPFHEDNVLYDDLRNWMAAENLDVLIGDGEGAADARIVQWSRERVIDVLQIDIYHLGVGAWWDLANDLSADGCQMSPHTYGGGLANHVTAQLAASNSEIQLVEWDEVTFDEIDSSAYRIEEGQILIPDAPGMGLDLIDDAFAMAVANHGFTLIAG